METQLSAIGCRSRREKGQRLRIQTTQGFPHFNSTAEPLVSVCTCREMESFQKQSSVQKYIWYKKHTGCWILARFSAIEHQNVIVLQRCVRSMTELRKRKPSIHITSSLHLCIQHPITEVLGGKMSLFPLQESSIWSTSAEAVCLCMLNLLSSVCF